MKAHFILDSQGYWDVAMLSQNMWLKANPFPGGRVKIWHYIWSSVVVMTGQQAAVVTVSRLPSKHLHQSSQHACTQALWPIPSLAGRGNWTLNSFLERQSCSHQVETVETAVFLEEGRQLTRLLRKFIWAGSNLYERRLLGNVTITKLYKKLQGCSFLGIITHAGVGFLVL